MEPSVAILEEMQNPKTNFFKKKSEDCSRISHSGPLKNDLGTSYPPVIIGVYVFIRGPEIDDRATTSRLHIPLPPVP